MSQITYLKEFANIMTGNTGLTAPVGGWGQGPTMIHGAGQVPARPVKKPIKRLDESVATMTKLNER